MKFLLKTLSASLVLASVTGVAFAGHYKDVVYKDAAPCPKLMGGWYLGAQLGYDMFKVDELLTSPTLTANPELAANGFAGGLFGGYGTYWNAFYLGGELFVNTSGADTSWNTTGTPLYTSKFEAKTSYGFNILPGWRLNDETTGFFKLGYNRVDVEHRGSSAGGATVSQSHNAKGFSYGVGVETLLTGNWSMRMDYTHYNLNSFTNTIVVAPAVTSKNDVSDNQFMVGVVYHIV